MLKLKFFFLKLKSYFPTQIPKGATSLNVWIGNIIFLAGKEIPDNRSTRFAVATMIMHAGTDRDSVPMNKFVKKLRKAASNEVAYSLLSSMKDEQEAAIKARQDALLDPTSTEQKTVASPTLTVV